MTSSAGHNNPAGCSLWEARLQETFLFVLLAFKPQVLALRNSWEQWSGQANVGTLCDIPLACVPCFSPTLTPTGTESGRGVNAGAPKQRNS